MNPKTVFNDFGKFLEYCKTVGIRIVKLKIETSGFGFMPGSAEELFVLTVYSVDTGRIAECKVKSNGIYGVSMRSERSNMENRLMMEGMTVIDGKWDETEVSQALGRDYETTKEQRDE